MRCPSWVGCSKPSTPAATIPPGVRYSRMTHVWVSECKCVQASYPPLLWMTQREVMREPVVPRAARALTALHVHACRAGPGAPRLPDGGPRGGLLAGGRGDCLLIALPPHRQV